MLVAYTRGLQSRVRRWHDLGPSPPKPCGDQPFSCNTSNKLKRGADLNITNSNHYKIDKSKYAKHNLDHQHEYIKKEETMENLNVINKGNFVDI
jgi:hypothetical protein